MSFFDLDFKGAIRFSNKCHYCVYQWDINMLNIKIHIERTMLEFYSTHYSKSKTIEKIHYVYCWKSKELRKGSLTIFNLSAFLFQIAFIQISTLI